MKHPFRSLNNKHYRRWALGSIVSNIGTTMQQTAQSWLVLTHLTHQNAAAVGGVMAFQFAPQILLLALTGWTVDHFNRRKILLVTQASMAILTLSLGLLTIYGHLQLWHVFVFALLLGCTAAFDLPARKAFVSDVVDEAELPNAIALNAASFQTARMIGPAIAGILIGMVDFGWVFIINAISFLAMIGALCALGARDIHPKDRAHHVGGRLTEGMVYVWQHQDFKIVLVILLLIGTFGMNFAISISNMSATIFHTQASQYGLLMTMMALGSIGGTLIAAQRAVPAVSQLCAYTALFSVSCALAAMMPSYFFFGMALICVGAAVQNLSIAVNSFVQLKTAPLLRGRVIAFFLAAMLGGAAVGAPIVGWIANHFGPRWSFGAGSVAALIAAAYGRYAWRKR